MKSIYCSILLFCVFALASNAAIAVDSSDASSAEITSKKAKKVNLVIRISTPHNNRAMDSCRVYPYPVAPPHRKGQIAKLPVTDTGLHSLLQGMGYITPTSLRKDRPYPAGGWRMQYALRDAEEKSGIPRPHTIFTLYPWIDTILPYVRKEVMHANEIEIEREQRYAAAQQMFDDHRSDLEVEAFNQGLFPIDIPLRPWHGDRKQGSIPVVKGNWWIVAFHKIPGLKYYWLWPVKLSDAPDQLVELNEDNAIFIEGGW